MILVTSGGGFLLTLISPNSTEHVSGGRHAVTPVTVALDRAVTMYKQTKKKTLTY